MLFPFELYRTRMALTAAEKQRRYRQKRDQDPAKRLEYLLKRRDNWKSLQASGKVKPIDSLNEREKRHIRKIWRFTKRDYRKRQNQTINIVTPPNSPVHIADDVQIPRDEAESSSKSNGRTKRKRNRQKLLKKVSKLQLELEQQKRVTDKFKKRWQREKNKTPDTPRRKTMKILRHATAAIVQRKLLLHNIIVDEMKRKYRSEKKERKKKAYINFIAGSMAKKYHLQKAMQSEIGFSHKRWKKKNIVISGKNTFCSKYASRGARYRQVITDFYIRDDNSRMTPGKGDTITRHKDKIQKRLLNDSITNLHAKFCAENPTYKLSYTLFSRLRPFWVVHPTEKDRQTCLCKLHSNFQMVVSKLHSLHVISINCIDELVENVSCDTKAKKCMYGECTSCEESEMPLCTNVDMNEKTTWTKWATIKETRIIKDKPKVVSLMVKQDVEGSIGDLVNECKCLLERYKRHSFNIIHQHHHYRSLQQTMGETECLVHIDFSENYVCKLREEVQSMHFGASKKQVTLHTGVVYIGKNEHKWGFCSMSDSLQHSPAAIWAHLKPVLDEIQSTYKVDTVHFFSDGPTTQYRQRGNFYLFSKKVAQRGFKFSTWNFHEAGHGKGAPDGIGATVKRLADKVVLQGKDIPNAQALFEALEGQTSVKLYQIDAVEVETNVEELSQCKIPPVPGTMSIHQVLWKTENEICYRDVSCLCNSDQTRPFCDCYQPKSFKFPVTRQEVTVTIDSNNNQSNARTSISDHLKPATTSNDTSA